MRWREVLVEGVLSGQILKDPIVRWLTTILWLWDDWLLHYDGGMIDNYTMIVEWLTTIYYDCEMIDYYTNIVRWLTTILWLWDDKLLYGDCEMIDNYIIIVRWVTTIQWF